MKRLLLLVSHTLVLAIGVGLGIYALPILTAPPGPTSAQVQAQTASASYKGEFRRTLKDSDPLHWGEGTVSVSAKSIGLVGKLSPGPDYKLYLSPSFVETEAEFNRLKPTMVRVADIKTFENFLVPVPESVDPARFNTVVVWCESFGQFISAAQYK